MTKQDFLLEIGTEEIPARFIEQARKDLGNILTSWLEEQLLSYDQYQTFATPRRLSIHIEGLATQQQDQSFEVRGPAAKIAKNEDGSWSKAALGFAKKQDVSVEQLQIKEYKGNAYVFAYKRKLGANTINLLQTHLPELLSRLSFPTMMRWGGGYRFVRPVRWVVSLFGENVVSFTWSGVKADRVTQGHRFLGSAIALESPKDYVPKLLNEYVCVDVEERKQSIVQQIQDLEKEKGWRIPIDFGLLEEVTHLVEYPTILVGQMNPDFLKLPKQVLITTMQEHQRYFPVEDEHGRLLPYFVTVRNGGKHHLDGVKKGNEKVIEARLSDASFFYQEDLKRPLEDAVKQLDRIIFRQELGSMGDRVRRIQRLALQIAEKMDVDPETMKFVDRAAELCKFDLATLMVDEFSTLEGEMGYEYARAAGEDIQVAEAIREHYRPRYAGDEIPKSSVSKILALADKMDMIVSCFGIGAIPTGSQDPYSLRRKALGILQILLTYPKLSLITLYEYTIDQLRKDRVLQLSEKRVSDEFFTFMSARLKNILQEQGIRYDVINSLLSHRINEPSLQLAKAKVLMTRIDQEEFKYEVEAFTRAAHLVYANPIESSFDPEHISEEKEKALYQEYLSAKEAYEQAERQRDTNAMYQALRIMVPAIHSFFDHVMVMVEDQSLRQNRLALLQIISTLTESFADFRKLVFP